MLMVPSPSIQEQDIQNNCSNTIESVRELKNRKMYPTEFNLELNVMENGQGYVFNLPM